MIRIVAAAYRDGWAFVADEGRMLLVRPPYRRGAVEVSADAAEQAVARYGFEAQDVDVPDFRAVVALLERRRVEIAEEEGAPSLPEAERMDRLVRSAPHHILERYLDRVESELLRHGEIDAALRVLSTMSRADVKHADEALRERISRLIAAAGEIVAWRRSVADPIAARFKNEARLKRKFPYLSRRARLADVRLYESERAHTATVFPSPL